MAEVGAIGDTLAALLRAAAETRVSPATIARDRAEAARGQVPTAQGQVPTAQGRVPTAQGQVSEG